MMHPVAIGVGVLAALLLLAELAAVPLASRALGDALGRCLRHGSVTIEEVGRPAVPRLLVGRARDVVLVIEDAELEGLRVAEAIVELPQVALPWALGDPDPSPATVHLRVDEAAVAERLHELAPLGLRPRVELDHGVVRIGVPLSRLEVAVSLDVGEDGDLLLQPGIGPPEWWARLGLARQIELPADVQLEAVAIDADGVTATLHVESLPGTDGRSCDEPVATPGSSAASAGAVPAAERPARDQGVPAALARVAGVPR